MMANGEWSPNITCNHCHHRHPAHLTCKQAGDIADTARAKHESEQESKYQALLIEADEAFNANYAEVSDNEKNIAHAWYMDGFFAARGVKY